MGSTTVPFLSKDAGNIYIQASCSNISSTSVLIEDCSDYDPCTSNSGKWTFQTGSVSYMEQQ